MDKEINAKKTIDTERTIEVTDGLRRIVNAVSKDRAGLDYIQVLENKVHATNGIILIELNDVPTEGMNGKPVYLSPKMIKSHTNKCLPLAITEDNTIIARSKPGSIIKFDHLDQTYPEVDRVKIQRDIKPAVQVTFDVGYLTQLLKCFDKNDTITFNIYEGKFKPVKVIQNGNTGVIMPRTEHQENA
jgi:hypothetical protein